MEFSLSCFEYIAWLAALTVLLFLSNYIVRHHHNRYAYNFPPGPKPWPIIGNFNLIGSLPHRSYHQLTQQYGPLMMLRLGSHRVLVASSLELAKIILHTQDISFASRPKTAAGYYTTYKYSDILWAPYGPYLRQGRRICLMELFTMKRLDSFEYIRVQERNSLFKELFDQSRTGNTVKLKDYLLNVSLNVISRMVLGKRYLDNINNEPAGTGGGKFMPAANMVTPAGEFKEMLEEWFLLNGVLNIGDWIPYIDFLDVQGYVKRMKRVAKKFDRFMEILLDEHNERRKNEKEKWSARDMVDVLLELADDPNLEVKLDRDGIKAITLDLIAGGTESSAVTVEWAISELVKNPEIMKKAKEELDHIIGRQRWVQENDIPNLPFIRAIVKETMRYHPLAPLLTPRIAREDVKILGYDVPKDTIVIVNTWTIQRDPQVYDDPETFRPERFIGKPIDVKGHHFELLPFGSGRRMCPGYTLGLKIIETNLANLVHGFDWSLPQGMKPEDMDMMEIAGLSNPKEISLLVVPKPRLPPHLYNL